MKLIGALKMTIKISKIHRGGRIFEVSNQNPIIHTDYSSISVILNIESNDGFRKYRMAKSACSSPSAKKMYHKSTEVRRQTFSKQCRNKMSNARLF